MYYKNKECYDSKKHLFNNFSKKPQLLSLGQAGFIIKSVSGQTLGIDLYLSDCVERVEGHKGFKRMLPKLVEPSELYLDFIVSTHHHRDHFDVDAIPSLMSNGAKLVTAYDCKDDVDEMRLDQKCIEFVKAGDNIVMGDFLLHFVECDHGSSAPDAVGVVVEVDGKIIYLAGDTCFRMDYAKRISEEYDVDVVIGPINGEYGNMNSDEFVEFAHIFKAVAIPCHYGMFPSHGGDIKKFYERIINDYSEDEFVVMAQGEYLEL